MTFLWYDLETFGLNPCYDRIAQFASLRTDSNFEVLEEPTVLYGRLSPDYLPDPDACLSTGITPQKANAEGLSEIELIKAIDAQFSQPETCVLGYNSINFDDEFVRNLYYRNFYNPYAREWASGNSRWDILNLTRATRDLRPDGIQWPSNDKGSPTVKLELLTQANGLSHEKAHDALSDVYATLALAKLLREKQPKIFEWAFQYHTKEKTRSLLDLDEKTPLIHCSRMFYSARGNTTLVSPILADPLQKNKIYAFDLRYDPEPLLKLSVEEIRRRIFTKADQLRAEGIERIPLKGISVNKAPFLAPATVLDKALALRLGLDTPLMMERWRLLQRDTGLVEKLHEVYRLQPSWPKQDDPDGKIYEGFFPDHDNALFERIKKTPPEELPALNPRAQDPRVPEMLRRFIGRNYPETLHGEAAEDWKNFCASRLLHPPVSTRPAWEGYRQSLASYLDNQGGEGEKKTLIRALEDYRKELEEKVF